MSNVYRITPLEKKSMVWQAEMYRVNEDESISWFNVEETWRWGQGFIDQEDGALPYDDVNIIYCQPQAGWGSELDDLIACYFEFSDDLTEEERQEIEEAYEEGGASWLFDGDHNWLEESSEVAVVAPFKIDLCKEDGTVIEEDIKLQPRPEITPSAAWPFPTTENL